MSLEEIWGWYQGNNGLMVTFLVHYFWDLSSIGGITELLMNFSHSSEIENNVGFWRWGIWKTSEDRSRWRWKFRQGRERESSVPLLDSHLCFFQTSISERFSKGAFNRDYNQTLGIDYYLKRINLTRMKKFSISSETNFLLI